MDNSPITPKPMPIQKPALDYSKTFKLRKESPKFSKEAFRTSAKLRLLSEGIHRITPQNPSIESMTPPPMIMVSKQVIHPHPLLTTPSALH